jgi:hypothetical protein
MRDQSVTLRLNINPDLWLDAAEANPAFKRCTTDIITDVIDRFAIASLDYQDGAQDLGIKGQFADINRKVLKLRKALWDGKPLVGESVQVVLSDLIAHCLLTLDMISTQEVAVVDAVAPQDEWCHLEGCIIRGPHMMSSHEVLR